MLLIESFNNDQKLSKKTYLFLEYREVKYPVSPLNFLESDFLIISLSLPSPLPSTSASSVMSNNAIKLLADLVMELVLLPTSAFLAMFNSKFSTNLVMIVLIIKVSGLALLKS